MNLKSNLATRDLTFEVRKLTFGVRELTFGVRKLILVGFCSQAHIWSSRAHVGWFLLEGSHWMVFVGEIRLSLVLN